MKLTKHFKLKEFTCRHCGKGEEKIDPVLVAKLEVLRSLLADKPIIVTSGYRCESHNQTVGGAVDSQHLKGKAADIVVKGLKPYQVYYYADKVFANSGVGFYKTHIHVDTANKRRWEG